jgi:xylulokinase
VSVVAGVDSSTQSCTVSLHDTESGAELGRGQARHPGTTPPLSEQHPEDWWTAFRTAFGRACSDAGRPPSDVAAISVAAQYHGLVVLDADDRVLRAAKLWNDTTSSPQARRLVAALGEQRWATRVGSVPTAAFTITKLAWLRENEPDVYRRVASVMVPHDWLSFQLTGQKVTDRVDASGTGYFDAAADEWCTDLLQLVEERRDWPRLLPRVAQPSEPAGSASTDRARELGLRPGTRVACGTGDQAAAALALGVEDGDVVVSLGTSGTVYGSSAVPVHDARGLLNVTANARGGFQPIAVLLNAAKVTDGFCRLLGVDHDEMAALALAADPMEQNRPVLVAYLDGERSPNRPGARGLLAGLSSGTTREALALSVFEGVALGLFAGHEALVDIGVDTSGRLLLAGGASRSPAYRAVVARIFGKDVQAPDGDGSIDVSRGAAIQASTVAQDRCIDDVVADWRLPVRTVVHADPAFTERADQLRALYSRAAQITSLDGAWDEPLVTTTR